MYPVSCSLYLSKKYGISIKVSFLSQTAARHRALRQRTVSLCRRNSETYSLTGADINRSHISLNQLASLSRRQMSLTQSEPDSDKDAPIAQGSAHPGKNTSKDENHTGLRSALKIQATNPVTPFHLIKKKEIKNTNPNQPIQQTDLANELALNP